MSILQLIFCCLFYWLQTIQKQSESSFRVQRFDGSLSAQRGSGELPFLIQKIVYGEKELQFEFVPFAGQLVFLAIYTLCSTQDENLKNDEKKNKSDRFFRHSKLSILDERLVSELGIQTVCDLHSWSTTKQKVF